MENKLQHPTLFMLVGIPGSGKTYLARQLSRQLDITRVSGEQIRSTLLNHTKSRKTEEQLVRKTALFLIEELLKHGLSVICDIPLNKNDRRSELRKLAKTRRVKVVTIYQQLDRQAAWLRCQSRHSRQADDRFALKLDRETFSKLCNELEPPTGKGVIVVSGVHNFKSQAQTIFRRLIEMLLMPGASEFAGRVPKPGLINLISANKRRQKERGLNIHLKKDSQNGVGS